MNIVTDSAGLNEPKDTNTPLFKIYSLFLTENQTKELKERYKTPGLKYVDIKNELYQCVMDYFADQRLQKESYLNKPDDIFDLMALGKDKAKAIATKTLEDVKKSIGIL
jgi:tryptophanyl-tRNA synthetase